MSLLGDDLNCSCEESFFARKRNPEYRHEAAYNCLVIDFRAGAPHIGLAGRLDWITSSDSGQTWSKPQVLAESPDDDRNPAFGQLRDGTLILDYCIVSGYDEAGTGLSKNRVKRMLTACIRSVRKTAARAGAGR